MTSIASPADGMPARSLAREARAPAPAGQPRRPPSSEAQRSIPACSFFLPWAVFLLLLSQLSAQMPYSERPSLTSSDPTYPQRHIVMFSPSEVILFTYLFAHLMPVSDARLRTPLGQHRVCFAACVPVPGPALVQPVSSAEIGLNGGLNDHRQTLCWAPVRVWTVC